MTVPFAVFIAAAHALLRFALDDGAARLYERAATLLTRAIGAESARLPTEQLPGLLAQAYVELGICREMLRDAAGALERVHGTRRQSRLRRELMSRNLTKVPTERLFDMALKAQEEGQRVAPALRLGVEEDVMATLNKGLEKTVVSWTP